MLKSTCFMILVGAFFLALAVGAEECTTLMDGTLTYSTGHYYAGQPIPVGYDAYGYNYQSHMFKGSYFNVYSGGANLGPWAGDDAAYLASWPDAATHWAWPYRSTQLVMKWSDSWLSNKDCDGDGELDRHYGYSTYIGSGAWETNHMRDTYEDYGEQCEWDWFVKIVAAPNDAYKLGGYWYAADGSPMGPDTWGAFATVQSVYNDPCGGFEGLEYKGARPGFGGWED